MTKENEVEIKDEDIQEEDFKPEELADDTTDWKAKAQELKGIAKRRATQLSKVKEKFGELGKKVSDYETELNTLKQKPPEKKQEINKSNEPDYGRLAYLHARSIDHADDIKVVEEEAKRLNLSLSDVLQFEHIQKKLETNKDERNAKAGMPSGTKRSGGYTQHDVEYYLQNPEKHPEDQELAEKVLEAKQKLEKSGKQFSDIAFTG